MYQLYPLWEQEMAFSELPEQLKVTSIKSLTLCLLKQVNSQLKFLKVYPMEASWMKTSFQALFNQEILNHLFPKKKLTNTHSLHPTEYCTEPW